MSSWLVSATGVGVFFTAVGAVRGVVTEQLEDVGHAGDAAPGADLPVLAPVAAEGFADEVGLLPV